MIKKLIMTSLMTAVAATCFSQTFNQQRLDSLFNVLEKNDKFMGSIAVSQNGKQIYAKAIGFRDIEHSEKVDTKTRYRIGSVSKMFTAVLVLKAVEEGKISLKQTLDKYYPQIENSSKITIENLLNHRSGIFNFTNDPAYLSYLTEAKSEKEMVDIIAKKKSNFEPNSKEEYSNSNYVLLSYILEKVYGKSYAKILSTKITGPLGLANTYFGSKTDLKKKESYSYGYDGQWVKDPETDLSIPMGAGAIVSTPTDLTVFIEQLFAGKLISDKSLTLMKTINENFGIGMVVVPYANRKGYGHSGGIDKFQSILLYFPEEKISIAIISNGLIYPLNNVLKGALSAIFNQPFVLPTFTLVTLKSADLDAFLGTYGGAQFPLKIAITKNENKLVAQATGQSSFELDATSANTFQYEKGGIVLEFNVEKKEMTLKQGGRQFVLTKE